MDGVDKNLDWENTRLLRWSLVMLAFIGLLAYAAHIQTVLKNHVTSTTQQEAQLQSDLKQAQSDIDRLRREKKDKDIAF